jgi:hypothetical protein
MKMYWRSEYLTSAMDGGEQSASSSVRFTPEERVPRTHGLERSVGLKANLARWWREKTDLAGKRIPLVQPID